MLKKIGVLLIILMLTGAILISGCQPEPATTTRQTTTATTTAAPTSTTTEPPSGGFDPQANTFPIVTEKTTLTVLALDATPQVRDVSTNRQTKYWEDRTGLELVFTEWVPAAASQQKLSAVMASGDLPDVILRGMSSEQMVSFGIQGLIIPLNDYVEKWGVNLHVMWEDDPRVPYEMIAPDGNIYYLPNYSARDNSHVQCFEKCLINVSWLTRLGLDMPKTTEEFYNVMVQFRDEDANGNGDPTDEIPVAAVAGYFETFFMDAFQYNSKAANTWLYVENGVLDIACNKDGFREGLRYMARLYQNDLTDKEIFIATRDQVKMYTATPGGSIVGASPTYAWSHIMDITTDIVNEYEFLEPLIGPDGTRQTPWVKNPVVPSFFITSACKIPDIAFRWGDAMLIKKLENKAIDSWKGEEGVDWRYALPGEYGLDGKTPAVYKVLFAWGEQTDNHWYDYGLHYFQKELVLVQAVETSGWDQERKLYEATINKYLPYGVQGTVSNRIMFAPNEVQYVGQLKETLTSFVRESMSKFVTGTMSLDNEWDAYLAELDRIGINEFVELNRRAYDRQFTGYTPPGN